MKRLILSLLLISVLSEVSAQNIKSPEATFGFKIGADRKLLNWSEILTYFKKLDESSPRVQMVEIGRTTLGRTMGMAIISSEKTIRKLGKYKDIQQQLARPFDLKDSIAETLIEEGKLVFLITMNIHSTEIASSQAAVEFAYRLATSDDPEVARIRNQIIVLLVPSLNPDGQDMVTKWYLKDVGTEHEGSYMPSKYHHYADHDNNRDWFFFNLVESRNLAKILYHEWYPEVVLDIHQMGSSGARIFLPPYADPVNPNVPPSVMANVNAVGKHVVAELHEQGFKGIATGTIFNAFYEGSMSKTPLWHNRLGMLVEVASARIASPLFFPKTSLRGMGTDLPDYTQQNNFLDPWPGGWWRMRDIIDVEMAATFAMLELTATYKEKYKRNFYRLNKEAISAGRKGGPFAYIIPNEQQDPNNAIELLRRLRLANVDVYQTQADFSTDAGDFAKDAFIIPLAQPTRAYIKDLMETQHYPDLLTYPDGPPRPPYDVTAWTLPLQLGVTAMAVNEPFSVDKTPVTEPKYQWAEPALADSGWVVLERRFNHSFKLINYLLESGLEIYSTEKKAPDFSAGDFLLKLNTDNQKIVQQSTVRYEVPATPVAKPVLSDIQKVKPARVALYQPWLPWVYGEGWLRLVLDNFGFTYSVLHNEDFRSRTRFANSLDVLIFASQSAEWIVNGKSADQSEPLLGEPQPHKEFLGGIGRVGVEKVLQFLQDGGTVLFFGEACDFAIEYLGLPATNVLKKLSPKDYFAPGSIFEMQLNPSSPLAYGMNERVSVYKTSAVALELKPYDQEIRETGFFASHGVLQSGWAVGENRIEGKVALAEIPVGSGRVILYAFRPQHRGQTYGTFKLIFNALYKLTSTEK